MAKQQTDFKKLFIGCLHEETSKEDLATWMVCQGSVQPQDIHFLAPHAGLKAGFVTFRN